MPRAHVGYEMIRFSLAIIISYSASASGMIVLLKTPQNMDKSSQLYFVRTNVMLQCTKTLSGYLIFMRVHGIVAHNPLWLSQ